MVFIDVEDLAIVIDIEDLVIVTAGFVRDSVELVTGIATSVIDSEERVIGSVNLVTRHRHHDSCHRRLKFCHQRQPSRQQCGVKDDSELVAPQISQESLQPSGCRSRRSRVGSVERRCSCRSRRNNTG